MVGAQVDPAFERATIEVKKLTEEPSNEDSLRLYALYKIGYGIPIESAKQPGSFDYRGKYKMRAWKEMVEKGVKPQEAQKQYAQFVEEIKPKYKYDPKK